MSFALAIVGIIAGAGLAALCLVYFWQRDTLLRILDENRDLHGRLEKALATPEQHQRLLEEQYGEEMPLPEELPDPINLM